jgi:two-component system response regulator AlgR
MRVLIVDDEPLARRRMRDLLLELAAHEIVGEAGNGRVACEMAAEHAPDVVLLDISMPVLDGLEAARHMSGLDPAPAVIFCTAFDEHALAAFEAGAVDYLVKPIRRERLEEALLRPRRYSGDQVRALDESVNGSKQRTHLCARIRGSLRLIALEDVRYLQAEEKYVVVHHVRGEDLIEDSLKSLEAEFGDRFLRIHRNCLIARDQLQGLQRDPDGKVRVRLRDDEDALEVSHRCLPLLRQHARSL